MAGKLKVLLIDDDAEPQDLIEVWERILKPIWMNVEVNLNTNFEEGAIEKYRPHIIIVDNVLVHNGREIDNKGVELIAENKSKNPDSIFILFTNKTFTLDILGYWFPNPDLLVTKIPFPNEDYEKEVGQNILRFIKRLPVERITFPVASDFDSTGLDFLEVTSILEQCAFSFQAGSGEEIGKVDPITQVNLYKIGGGYSGSFVYRCEFYGLDRASNSKFILKISDNESMERETMNYNLFARLQMPHHVRVDLVGVGKSRSIGGALYAFAFGGDSEISSVTDQLISGSEKSLINYAKNIIEVTNTGWYQRVENTFKISEYFNNRQEYSPSKDTKRINGIIHNINRFNLDNRFTANTEILSFENQSAPHCRRLIQDYRNQDIEMTICHGDLNTNNIIVLGDDEGFSLIDFDYTGFDSIYKDLISLETSMRVYYRPNENVGSLKKYISNEEYLNKRFIEGKMIFLDRKNRKMALPIYSEIFELRKLAKELFSDRSFEFDENHYLLCLSFHLFKLCGLNIWNEDQFRRLISAYISVNLTISAST